MFGICEKCGRTAEISGDLDTDRLVCLNCFFKSKQGVDMGKLADRAREKSPFVKLDIGEESSVLVYKSWKETTDNFGNDTFRYFFELTTETGIITKQLDNRSQSFAESMDKIAFGEKVIVKREPKLDHEGEPLENRSIWSVRRAEEIS